MKQGLQPLIEDVRDFPLGGVFGVEKDLPTDFIVSGADELIVKDQGNTDLCSAYVVCSCSELQEKVELNPEYQFAFSKLISGDMDAWGQNLRDACKTPIKYGSLEEKVYLETGFYLKGAEDFTPRNWENWGEEYFGLAQLHKKKSYFRADLGLGNKFDLLKSAIFKHDSAIVSGMNWKYSDCKGGIITPNKLKGIGHAITIIGWVVIDKIEHLVIHNSIGNKGDKGRWYLPREMVRELRYGNYMFIDLPVEEARHYIENGILITDNFFVKIWKIIINFFKI